MIDPSKLEKLFKPSNFSLEKEREQSVEVSEYNIKNKDNNNIKLSEALKIYIDDSLLKINSKNFEKITGDEFFDLLNSEQVLISPEIKFPKIEKINTLYALLDALAKKDISSHPIIFIQDDEDFNELIESLVFFKFFEVHNVEDNKVYLVTEYFNNFIKENNSRKYIYFVKILGANDTVRRALSLQINVPVYDRISKQMITNYLIEDVNIIEENLDINSIKKIMNNFRYWYLDIRTNLLI